uniref:Uncharacterized protein n=1 Tax=Timema cristinae TaxID=61476 RepID=A0A7R9DFU2_TIMCR|nr:unnamed protein product [Timema cristinae]
MVAVPSGRTSILFLIHTTLDDDVLASTLDFKYELVSCDTDLTTGHVLGYEGGTRKYCPPDFIDRETEDGTVEPGAWREFYAGAFLGLNRIGANHAAADAYKARDDLSHYLLTPEGEISGQWKYIKREQSGIEWELKMDT